VRCIEVCFVKKLCLERINCFGLYDFFQNKEGVVQSAVVINWDGALKMLLMKVIDKGTIFVV